MYKINTLRRKVLITYEEVVDQAPVSNSPDLENIRHAIQIAEERFIVDLIGRGMYDEMREAKNRKVTDLNKDELQLLIGAKPVLKEGDFVNAIEFIEDEWQQTLWTEHLWKIVAECVYYVANPTVWGRHTAAGVVNNNPQTPLSDGKGAASVYRKDLEYLQDNALMNRIDPLISGMKRWVNHYHSNFPLWPREHTNCCGPDEPEVNRKSAYVNIYKDHHHACR